ncbi:DUF2695 domain-containing protein [Bacillus cereus]|uniref:DUF2695 domain-containing protein n=1 Tax=Bacillus cereus TaxID=1396 RepID=UPI001A32A28E|nr:DUF2695 domain-containing protein [Bacillus cereus]MBJ6722518.1 DUF2695 domain-containing protein [Bacillus sp. PR5]MCC2455174.1 DUF2695 domain-containing protein [Bacillus cereus]MCU5078683.1 DUF2695 domain-containing protein [Bacillus cereus]
MDNLEVLKSELIKGQKLAMQGSYERKEPSKKAIPYLLKVKKGLYEYIKLDSDNALAWRLLSQCEECLLNYQSAITSLQKVMSLNGGNKKDLKKLALLKEYNVRVGELNLSVEQLNSLEGYLQENLKTKGCDHSLIYTKDWLNRCVPKSMHRYIIRAMRNRGGYCDCEVLMNIVE